MTTKYPRIKRTVPGVGKVRLTTGARTQRQYAQRVSVFDDLVNADQPAVIKALMAGDITWAELVEHRRERGRFGAGVLTDVKANRSLAEAVEATLPKMGKSEGTRARYGVTWKRLHTLLGPITVNDLATVEYDVLKGQWGRSAGDWNNVGRFLSAFLSKFLGKPHPLRYAVVAAFPRRRERPRVPDLTPAIFWKIVDKAPLHVQASFVTILLTGMRVDEYLAITPEHLLPHTHRIQVPGTKTDSSSEPVSVDPKMWPWIVRGVPPRVTSYKRFRLHWCRACVAAGAATWNAEEESGYRGPVLHDLRHSLAQWASDAGHGLAEVKAALRHTNLSTTESYARRSSSSKIAGTIRQLLKRKRA